MLKLSDKFFIITGAGGGIGRETAIRFSELGATLALLDVNDNSLSGTQQAIVDRGGIAFSYVVDLTREDQVKKTIEDIVQAHQTIDGLVNIAGGSGRRHGDGPVDQCTLDGWHFTLNLNLTSMFLMCKYTIPHLQNGGSIINLSSVLGLTGNTLFATHAYAASKGAIISMSRAMAVHYADHGIRVNVIAPGLVKTDMSARAESNEAITTMMKHLQPLTGSIGEARAVADTATFLASEDSKFITGVVIPVDGGWTAQ